MPRKGFIAKRDELPDPMYNSKVVTKLINNVMEDGKKGVAQKICYDAFKIINEKTGRDAMEVFEEAMNNIMPLLEVKARISKVPIKISVISVFFFIPLILLIILGPVILGYIG